MPHAPSRTKFRQDMSTLAATTQRQRTEKDGIDYSKESTIGKDCWENSVILLGVVIGDDITVGAGSVVLRKPLAEAREYLASYLRVENTSSFCPTLSF